MNFPGRPTNYKPEYCELALNQCLLGATNEQLGAFFGVTGRTIGNWITTIPEFADAVRSGRDVADARVASGLYKRAVGYTYESTRTMVNGAEERIVKQTVHCPPDVRACIHWLHNRQRRLWSERGDTEWMMKQREADAEVMRRAARADSEADAGADIEQMRRVA